MTGYCRTHNRYYCYDSRCRKADETHFSTTPWDNAGAITLDSSGDLSVGIGGGLGIDVSNGDITVGSTGFSFDTGSGF